MVVEENKMKLLKLMIIAVLMSFNMGIVGAQTTEKGMVQKEPQHKISFSFLIQTESDQFDRVVWHNVKKIVQDFRDKRKQASEFTMALLHEGLQAAQEVFTTLEKNQGEFGSWTLINSDPIALGAKLPKEQEWTFLHFWIGRLGIDDATWADLEKLSDTLVQYSAEAGPNFDLAYYCNEIEAMFAKVLKK